jgi:hypothetical protein
MININYNQISEILNNQYNFIIHKKIYKKIMVFVVMNKQLNIVDSINLLITLKKFLIKWN